MTVPANLNRVDYTGTGGAGPFTVPFPFYDASHLTVLQTDALFNQTTLTGWTATGAGGPSGAVTLAAACPVGSTLTIMRIVPLTQITSIKNQEAFYPEVHEQEMDLLAMADQQLDEAMDRTLRLPAGLSGVDMTLPKPDPGHALVWNAAGDGLENAGSASVTLQQDLADSADVAKGDALIAVKQPFTGAVSRTQHDKNAEWVSVLDFGADPTGVVSSSLAFNNAALAAGGSKILVPKGVFKIKEISGTNIIFCGGGVDATTLILDDTQDGHMFNCAELEIQDLTISDNGRPGLNHVGTPGCYLAITTKSFVAKHCKFLTDRCVLGQTPASNYGRVIVEDCEVERVNAPIPGESDAMNIFECGYGCPTIKFYNVRFTELVARSVINAAYMQLTAWEGKPITADIKNCKFDYIHNSGTDSEVKTIFLQGYTVDVTNNHFIDCFGRHIDILGNNDGTLSRGYRQVANVKTNKIEYTDSRRAATGFDNVESGSIYCRYTSASVENNLQDFTNLDLTSISYHGIVVRHGYMLANVSGNTIIAAKGHAIEADISDEIDVTPSNIFIRDNNINSLSASRKPISISVNSPTKTFDSVIIEFNRISYSPSSAAIIIDIEVAHSQNFPIKNLRINGNYHVETSNLDIVSFQAFPYFLDAPNTDVTVLSKPGGTNLAGVINSLSSAVFCANNYVCRSLTVKLDNSITGVTTLTGPLNVNFKPKTTYITDNGLGGVIRFYSAGTQQSNLGATLSGNAVVFTNCNFESDSVTSTTSLLMLIGHGNVSLLTCNANYGEYYVDTRGPSCSVHGGTVNNINLGSSSSNAVFYCASSIPVIITAKDLTGATNNRLYNFVTPTAFFTQNVSIGVTTGTKTFALLT